MTINMNTFKRIIAAPFTMIGVPLFAIALTIRFGSNGAKKVLTAAKDALVKVKNEV